jgi:argininosuccinate lyase
MAADDYLGLGSRLDSRPSELLVRTGFSTEIRQAGRLHYWLGVANLAHVLALRDAGVLPEAPGRRLLGALLDLLGKSAADSAYSPEHGDAYNSREHLLRGMLGADAGWLSLGRTRREAGRVSYYLAARAALLAAHETVDGLVSIARRRALAHAESWWADMTYWQPAQVSTFGHYLLSFAYEADRNLDRLRGAWERCALVPVAAGGVAGTTVPLSRETLLRRLGLAGPATTSRDAMWSVDGMLDVAFTAQQTALTARRLAEDFLLFATEPFGYVRLHDSHCRASVHLPQKRNPYALTVVRGGCAVVAGRAAGVAAAAATGSAQTDNWIYNYGETLDALDLARDLSALTAEVIALASFDAARMAAAALDGFTEAADLAERLVADHGIDYRTAHSLVGRATTAAEGRGERRLSPADLRSPALGPDGTPDAGRDAPLLAVDPRSLVEGRPHDGGAAPARVRASARRLGARLARQRAWRTDMRAQAEAAVARLEAEARAAAAGAGPRTSAHRPAHPAPTAPDNRRICSCQC